MPWKQNGRAWPFSALYPLSGETYAKFNPEIVAENCPMTDLPYILKTETSTSHVSWDWLRLGHTSGQRAAEIVAGLRAITFPSPEAKGLSSLMGRWFARFLSSITRDETITKATGGRHLCITRLAQEALAGARQSKVIVELAAGFSGRGLLLARSFPEAQVIEVDLPGVIEAKQNRVRRLVAGHVPANLHWLSADLGEVSLSKLLGKQTVDLVLAEGILPYFPHEQITQIAASIYASLDWQGVMIADLVSNRGWHKIEGQSRVAARLFKRQVGRFRGGVEDEGVARRLFEPAGFERINVYSLQELARTYLPELIVADVSFLLVAHKDG